MQVPLILGATDMFVGYGQLTTPKVYFGPVTKLAREVLPLPAWGLIILVIGALLTLAQLARGRFRLVLSALTASAAAGYFFFWACTAEYAHHVVSAPRTAVALFLGYAGLHAYVVVRRQGAY